MSTTVFTLRIFMYGLIAFVPSMDGTRMTILVPMAHDIRSPNPCANQDHESLLGFAGKSSECLEPEDCRPVRPKGEGNCKADGWWKLDEESVEIEAAGAQALTIRGQSKRVGLPESDGDLADFGWIAQMGSIEAKAGRVNDDLLQLRPPVGLLAARMTLNSGTIESCRLVGYPRRPYGPERRQQIPLLFFRSESKEAPQMQALTEVVRLTRVVSSDQLTVVFKNLQSGVVTRKIKLTPQDCGEGRCLDIFISNEPVYTDADIRGFCSHWHESRQLFSSLHFPVYYSLSQVSRTPWQRRFIPFLKDADRRTSWDTTQVCTSAIRGCLPIFDSDFGLGPTNRPICTVVTFAPVN